MTRAKRLVEVLPYDQNWPTLLEDEVERLYPIFNAAGVSEIVWHHIGSTSVPGLAAKPIIDMLPEVPDIERLGPADEEPALGTPLHLALQELGYDAKGEYGLPGRRYFRKIEGPRHLVHLHCYQRGHPEILRHLAFRDYLRAHRDIAKEYAELKIKLAEIHPNNLSDYMDGKDAFIKRVEKLALNWYQQNNP
jgi:GrpB-like predicted nucleotidyltransferase (UPF0157 family)